MKERRETRREERQEKREENRDDEQSRPGLLSYWYDEIAVGVIILFFVYMVS